MTKINRLLQQRGREIRVRKADSRKKEKEFGEFFLQETTIGYITKTHIDLDEYVEYLMKLRGPDYVAEDFGFY